MGRKYLLSGILVCLFSSLILGQQETYRVKLAPFSSKKYDEFSPVYFKNGFVFCTNRKLSSLADYSNSQDKGTFKINYIDTTTKVTWKKAGLFSKSLNSRLNDGPVTFNISRDTIYYSRNLRIKGKLNELSTIRNKLGIFTAVLEENKWSKIQEFRFNNEWYNISTPSLSPDGEKLFFSSDKPGGYGGADLYYSQWKDGYWDSPVNLGRTVNTSGNESYPFTIKKGELFFSSDGHNGHGGKDIFYSRLVDTTWLEPVPLDSSINSAKDDFGFICDSSMSKGFFSSNRDISIDIYQFNTNFRQQFYCDSQRINQYCFRFTSNGAPYADKNLFEYEWDFGDSTRQKGLNVEHCFQKAGKYEVSLDLLDKATGKVFITRLKYDLEIKIIEQPYINSSAAGLAGDTLKFDGLLSYIQGKNILEYTWDFGDTERGKGSIIDHSYLEKGEYNVKLGLTLKDTINGNILESCVSKRITIFDNQAEMTKYLNQADGSGEILNVIDYDHAFIKTIYSADQEIDKNAVLQVEVLSSKTKLGANNRIFRNISDQYFVREVYLSEINTYRYVAEEANSLIALSPTLKDIVKKGFKEARIQTYIPLKADEKEFYSIKNVYGRSTDNFFIGKSSGLSTGGYAFLDQIIGFLKEYPEVKILIEIFSDELGSLAYNQELSQDKIKSITDYLFSKNIARDRLISRSYGKSRPLVASDTELNRKINRRIEFSII